VGYSTDMNSVETRKFLLIPGLELRSLDIPTRSQSLYRLRYPGSVQEDSKGIITCMIDCRLGFGLESGFIGHFNARLQRDHYSIHYVFSFYCVFTSRSLVTASNSGDSSASWLTLLLALNCTD
jgi:hypothetical protein